MKKIVVSDDADFYWVIEVVPQARSDAYVVSDEIFPELENTYSDDMPVADFGDPVSQLARLGASPDGLFGTLGATRMLK